MKHAKCYRQGYPRPQFTRGSFESLNGDWDFYLDYLGDACLSKMLEKFPREIKIVIPYSYTSISSGINLKKRCDTVWYNKSFDFSSKILLNKRAILYFEGADYKTFVWVNGKFVGEHTGAYSRFSFDITEFSVDGKADIVVKCNDDYSCIRPRGKQKWLTDNYGCWYTETTGIYKTVWVEFVSESRIDSVKISPDLDNWFVEFAFKLVGDLTGLSLQTIVSFNNQVVASSTNEVLRNEFRQKIDITTDSEPFKRYLWTADNPNLYDVEYVLYHEGKEIDRVGSYFGFRKVETCNDLIMLNDSPLLLKMILDQGYFANGGLTPTEQELIGDVMLTKEVALNGIRKHQKIEDDRFYYYCDIIGIYCWLEMPSAYEFSDSMIENFTAEWVKILHQHQNNPSIIALVPFNESWGVTQIYGNKKQQDFTVAMYYLSKSIMPDTLVISNDGWEHTKSDIITLHHYASEGAQLKEYCDNVDANLSSNKSINNLYKMVFAKGYKYGGEPLLISEFGGIAFQDNDSQNWGYGDKVSSEDAYLNRLEGLIDCLISSKKFSGYCLTQTTDVEQEKNGILTIDRKFKADKEKLKAIFKKQ